MTPASPRPRAPKAKSEGGNAENAESEADMGAEEGIVAKDEEIAAAVAEIVAEIAADAVDRAKAATGGRGPTAGLNGCSNGYSIRPAISAALMGNAVFAPLESKSLTCE